MMVSTVLFLLAVCLLQGALSTHLETCHCEEIGQMVNASVQRAVTNLERRLSTIDTTLSNSSTNERVLQNLVENTMERLLQPIKQQLDYHLPSPPGIGNSANNAAQSCKSLLKKYPQAESGYYWVLPPAGSPVRVYCEMNRTLCGGQPTGGWMRVANLDMRNTSHTCPSGMTLTSSPKRLCDVTRSNFCISKSFNVHNIQYSHVCGRIIAYQNRVPIAFYSNSRSIDEVYVCGVSLTHGQNPRKHIWTFAGVSDETTYIPSYKCPCTNTAITSRHPVPSYVGNDYFCDTALSVRFISVPQALQTGDPLWDGQGCGPTSTCCSFNTPPWFTKELPSPTTDDVEMRLCRPGSGTTPIEIVELYVQ